VTCAARNAHLRVNVVGQPHAQEADVASIYLLHIITGDGFLG
jgi:hypothetical protein